MLGAFFRRLPLRRRIMTMVALVELGFLVASSGIMFVNAQDAIEAEVRASEILAREFAQNAVAVLLREGEPEARIKSLPAQLQQPRHARIAMVGPNGEPLLTPTAIEHDDDVPEWFVNLLNGEERRTLLPITIASKTYGALVVTTDRRDEIAEVWTDTKGFFVAALVTSALLLIAIDLVISYSLRPLRSIRSALLELECQDYSVRISDRTTPDLEPIARGCNTLAAALERTLAEKDELNQALVHLQDRERKAIAMELHDEFGPCLFGIRMSANSILKEAKTLPNPLGARLTERSSAILDITDTMQAANRQLLERLRPMAIGHVPLPQLVHQFLESMATYRPEVEWQIDVDPVIAEASEVIQLTLYRVTQEAVNNALRHADAATLKVAIGPCAPPTGRTGGFRVWFAVRVEDDGRGIAGTWREGGGLHGMSNRVKSLGGSLSITAGSRGGAVVVAQVPDGEAENGGHAQVEESRLAL